MLLACFSMSAAEKSKKTIENTENYEAAYTGRGHGRTAFSHLEYPAVKSRHGGEHKDAVVRGRKQRYPVQGHHFFSHLVCATTATMG